MAKDLIIGGAAGYDWDKLKYWVNSIKASGFRGDIMVVATNITAETIQKLVEEKVLVSAYGQRDENGNFKQHSNGAPHVERFFYMWNVLNEIKENYVHVITTDTRDVVFQTNPSTWLNSYMTVGKTVVCSSEGLEYKNEPWGNQNLHDTFGPYFHNIFKENMIYNVGTIAGRFEYVRDLLLMIFQMSINRPIPIVDQAVFNFLVSQQPYSNKFLKTTNRDGWAIQLGTTVEAIKSGGGDIGQAALNDEEVFKKYIRDYRDIQPYIDEDGTVYTKKDGDRFCIVHQYDRIPSLKTKILEKYDDK